MTKLSDNHTNYLAGRGVLDAAAAAQWRPATYYDDTPGFAIPVIDDDGQRDRFRAITSTSDGYKTKWFGRSGAYTPKLYFAPGFVEAVERSGGRAILAAGEFDLLTFIAAGCSNVFSFANGEMSAPHDLAHRLKACSVSRLDYWPDHDDTGLAAAAKVRDLLAASGIHYEAHALRDLVAPKGDTNDLWQAVEFDRARFWHALENAPALDLPAAQPVQPPRQQQPAYTGDDFPPEFVRAVEQVIEQQPKARRTGDNLLVCSPLRDEQNPSFSYHTKKRVWFDHATGESGGIVELGRALGIDIADYRPHDTRPAATPGIRKPKPVTAILDTFIADLRVNVPYASQIDLSNRTIAVKSPIGTGKTQAIIEIIKKYRPERILFITHRAALTENIKQRLKDAGIEDFYLYRDFSGMTGISFGGIDRYIISIDSLHTLGNPAPYDLIVIDEVEQAYRHLYAKKNTMRLSETVAANHRTLEQVIKQARQVIALDAGLENYIVDWLRDLRGDCTAIENIHRQSNREIVVAKDAAYVVQQAIACAKQADGLPTVLATNSRAKARVYDALARQLLDGDVMTQHAYSSANNGDLLANLNAVLADLQLFITSPSVGTGVDVQTRVAGVFGVFANQPTTAKDNLQQLLRYRNADRRMVYQQSHTSNQPTDTQTVYDQQIAAINSTAQRADFATHGQITLTSEQEAITRRFAAAVAARNRLMNDTQASFYALARAEGFTLRFDESRADDMRQRLKDTAESLKNSDEQQVVTLPPVSNQELRVRKLAGEATIEDYLANRRYKVEQLLKTEITEKLAQEYAFNPRRRSAFRRFLDFHIGDRARLQQIDRQDAANLPYRRTHRTAHFDFFRDMVAATFGDLDNGERLAGPELAKRFSAFIQGREDEARIIDGRSDLSVDPVRMCVRMFERNFHIAVSKQQDYARDANGEIIYEQREITKGPRAGQVARVPVQVMYYWIDLDALTVLEARAAHAAAQLDDESGYVQTRESISYNRVHTYKTPPDDSIAALVADIPPDRAAELAAIEF